ncbi:MAG: exo-alpha-sialidase, partial [Verrucomicrobia bacterium]|nr:exo-alpha-sialidase [Verrucomicrobiota bacterium]
KVIRYRAPIFMAAVDTKTLRLVRATERVVLPMIGDPAGAPEHVAAMGNFHPINVTPDETWVTVGEERSRDGWRGDTLLARIRWSRPNRSV